MATTARQPHGPPTQPYTTGWLGRDPQLHLIRTALGRGQWRAACGDQGPVSRLKDRGAAEVLDHAGGASYDRADGLCRVCFTMGWFYWLGREAQGRVTG